MEASYEETKERFMEAYREEKRIVKKCIIQSKKKVNEQFGRKMNENVNGNRKLFWKEVSNVKRGKVESCSRVKMQMGGWHRGRTKRERFGRSILKICII